MGILVMNAIVWAPVLEWAVCEWLLWPSLENNIKALVNLPFFYAI